MNKEIIFYIIMILGILVDVSLTIYYGNKILRLL
jgi:hypothetical protein